MGSAASFVSNSSLPVSPTVSGGGRAPVIASLLTVYLVWSSTYLALRYMVEHLPPLLTSGVRFLLAGGLMYGVLRLRGYAAPSRRQCLLAIPVGALMFVVGNGFVAVAQTRVTSGAAAMSVAAIPLFAVALDRLFGRRPSRWQTVGLVIGFSGVVFMSVSDAGSAGDATLLLALAPLGWALGSVAATRLLAPGLMSAATQMLGGGAVSLTLGLVRGETFTHVPPARSLLAFVYLVLFGSIVAFSAYTYLLRRAPGPIATSYGYVNPLLAVMLGVTVGGEHLDRGTAIGGIMTIAGVAALLLGGGRRPHGSSATTVRRPVAP
jgi:drug/metabolite transporter (DMT)-like permease